MLTMFLSLAISFVSVQSTFPLLQQEARDSQTARLQESQRDKESPKTPYVLNLPGKITVNPIPLPPGDRAWAVQIVTAGGFTGAGRGNVTLTSDGMMQRFGPNGSCSQRLPAETLQAISETVFAAESIYNTDSSAEKLTCFDCVVTAMVVTRRKSAGNEVTLSASWDDSNQAKVATDILAIYQAVMANKDCKPQ